ncbi:hypothetical protein ABFX02_04G213100 [Erythranthe guttata]
MGVPSFYRWLVDKYPKIVNDAVLEEMNVECSTKNPNGTEFDNLYLDMNGIIHPCFHPEDDVSTPTTFEEVFNKIYEYIDRLFNIVRPRKLLFLAIDGVAPRAKMNQQRARRFRTAKDTQFAEEMEEKFRKQFEKEGKAVLPKEESQLSDSNVITPGTVFMHILSDKLRTYITCRMSENPAWTNIKVILSDDNVPGEGEHKIMSFIRAQRSSPGYDPNTRHCLYGLDADLIMLALATHEIHFSILREEILAKNSGYGLSVESTTHRADTHSLKSRGWFKEHPWQNSSIEAGIELEKSEMCKEEPWIVNKKQKYQFLNVWILREYLALDMKIPTSDKFEYDLERVIDDFIFICFFAGNDFLPHMPTLEIHEGGIDLLMHVYKQEFVNLGGYLVDMQRVQDKKGGYIKLKRVEAFILAVGAFEEKIFSKRTHLREGKLRRILSDHRNSKDHEKNQLDDGTSSDIVYSYDIANVHRESELSASAIDVDRVQNNTKELKKKLKEYIKDQSDLFKDGFLATDKVKLGSLGWKERYYREKFCAQTLEEIEETRRNVVARYGEGLCWVLLYYYSGVPSWTWFYPYHYGPFASDLKGLTQINLKFQKGLPFKPFDQLMGVLPPRSAHALPISYKELMVDENSNIFDFYPIEFETDTDGKRFLWQGISKLPFIDEGRLLVETRKLESELKDYEKVRNSQTLDRLFVSRKSREVVLPCETRATSKKIEGAIMMDSTMEGVKGNIHLMPEDLSETDYGNKSECTRNIMSMFYEYEIHHDFHNVPRLLEGVNIPERTVYEEDIVETILWHEMRGNGNRYWNNHRPIKPDHRWENSRPKNRVPAITSKFAGQGFSLGRGQISQDKRGNQGPGPVSTYRPPQVRNNFGPGPSGRTYGTSGNWRINNLQSRSDSVDSWRKDYGQSSSGPQYPNTGTGRGRGRGWNSTKTS